MTYDAVGPPLLSPPLRPVFGPRDDVTGHVIARTEFSLSYLSPHPQICLCMGGRGLRGPRPLLRPGHHLFEGGLGTRGSSPLTHTTSYAFCTPRHGGGVRIALYNRLFARSIITRCRGMGYKIPPWGKGLRRFRFFAMIYIDGIFACELVSC